MPAPKDPEKRALWIERLHKASSGSNNSMYGKHLMGSKNGMWGKKHTLETRELMSKNRKGILTGKDHPMWGKPSTFKSHTEEAKKKISKGLKGKLKGKHNSLKTEFKIGDSRLKGINNPNWKGGITSLTRKIRASFKYRLWKSDVFVRDDFTCQECDRRGGYLEAHHSEIIFSDIIEINDIKTFEQAMDCEELWNINNGKTLCKKCHNNTKKGRNTIKEMK